MLLEIGPNFKISVTGYLLFKRQEPARSSYVWLGGEKPQIAKGVTTQIADDTARTVEKWEIRKAYKFGGEQVSFTVDEQQALKNFGDPVIRIIGFKPLSALPFWTNMKHPTFIYPSEEGYVGSTRVFSALHQKLLKDEKMALVWFIPRKNAAPALAAMIPGAEKVDEDGVQRFPPGMWIIPLPFADDVRQNHETILNVAPIPLIDQMRAVIQQLQLPKAQYDPLKYPNPCKSSGVFLRIIYSLSYAALQWHYRILQALALDEDLPEKPEDKTIPKYRQIDKVSFLFVKVIFLCRVFYIPTIFIRNLLNSSSSALASMYCLGQMSLTLSMRKYLRQLQRPLHLPSEAPRTETPKRRPVAEVVRQRKLRLRVAPVELRMRCVRTSRKELCPR